MKNVFLTLALCVSLSGFAQIFNVGTIEKVNVERAKVAAISPQGDYLLLTSSDNQGLAKLTLLNDDSHEEDFITGSSRNHGSWRNAS